MIYEVKKCLIRSEASVKEALEKIDENQYGFIITCDENEKVLGVATDGDIRRALITGATLSDPIFQCSNKEFFYAGIDTPREQLIKRLDNQIRFIPLLDGSRKLQAVISKDYLPLRAEKDVYVRARAPVRISFGGGGSDLTHYFENERGAVINSAVSIYSHGVMKVRADSKIIISSLDLGKKMVAEDLRDAVSQDGPFGLIQSLLHAVQPEHGFELNLDSDFRLGSGLGGSATLSAVVLGCFNSLRTDQWDQHEVAEIAYQAERLHLGVAGGWQDQYASVFGGFNFIEFHSDENIVTPMKIHPDVIHELEASLVLCDTGTGHDSGKIHESQKHTMSNDNVRKMVARNVELSYEIRNHLLRGKLDRFGQCFDASWRLKRNFSPAISNPQIDEIYDEALANGAIGGKLLGAGGGGFFIFYVPPFNRHNLVEFLVSKKLSIKPFCFESEGLKTWSSRVGQ